MVSPIYLDQEPSQFHTGEQAVHRLLLPGRASQWDNPTHHGLPSHLGLRVAQSPLVAFGTLDRSDRPWATVWGGEAGFCGPVARDVLGVRATVDAEWDPVVEAFFKGAADKKAGVRSEDDDGVVKPKGGKVMAGLSIDLETRDRVKIAGRMVAGVAIGTMREEAGFADLQLALYVEESLGNCPKYLNKKHIVPHVPSPRLVSEGTGIPLLRDAVELIAKADLFFIASKHVDVDGNGTMDVNHRGGPPGFIRVLRNETKTGTTLIYPEYSGNRLYQTLGNLHDDPYAGLVVPDFETGNVLYVTGRAAILVGAAAVECMPRAKLVIKIDVEEARFVRDGLPFRGEVLDYSPYNPVVRRLACENVAVVSSGGNDGGEEITTATLIRRMFITPSISRYVFRLASKGGMGKKLKTWLPGQHVTLDFAAELDTGWSHMRDDDPQSLNDDFVRTFTVSAPPPDLSDPRGLRFEITVRRHGPVTRLLERWDMRVPLKVPVLGFGGAEGFRMATVDQAGGNGVNVFVAAGVGITPLMAQAEDVLEGSGGKGLRVLWSLKGEDVPLAVDVLGRIDGLGEVTRLFVTGDVGSALVDTVQGLGAEVVERRIVRGDLLKEGKKGRRKFYCCTGPEMMRSLLKWMEGEDVLYESFEY